MLKTIVRKIKGNSRHSLKSAAPPGQGKKTGNTPDISDNLDDNLKKIKALMQDNYDVNIRELAIGKENKRAFILNIEGLSNTASINANVLRALMHETRKASFEYELNLENIRNLVLTIDYVDWVQSLEEATTAAFEGYTILFLDGEKAALKILTSGWEHRGVQTPQTENVIRGPHEGFTETLGVNISMVRRRINNTALRLETTKIGRQTKTKVCMVYITGIAANEVVAEVRNRLKAIDIDGILDSGYIEELITDEPVSLFPTMGNTEIPDKFAAKILEGRVGIIVDGSPIALTVPYLFMEGIQSQEDYYSRFYLSSAIRIMRIMAFHITLFGPALYIGIVDFHPNIIPDKLLDSMMVFRSETPFPSTIEALLMLVSWEVLREAGVRVPRQSGQSLTIVGTLIIGQIVIAAKIAAPILLVIIAATGLMGFLYIPQINSISLLRIPLLVMASVFGFFGVIVSYIFMIIHLVSLRSFGSPYLSPLMPFTFRELKDTLIRAPLWSMTKRPRVIGGSNSVRQGGEKDE